MRYLLTALFLLFSSTVHAQVVSFLDNFNSAANESSVVLLVGETGIGFSEINATNVTIGTLADDRIANTLLRITGTGAGLSGINGSNVTLQSNITAGVVASSSGQNSLVWKTDANGAPAWRADATGAGPTTVIKTGDQGINSTTLANITDLAFSVTSGTNYQIDFGLYFQSNQTTNGLKLGVWYPSATIAGYTAYIPIAADGAGGEFQGWGTASADAVTETAVQAANTTYLARITMNILPSASGVVTCQFAGETVNLTTIKASSWGKMSTY